MLLYILVGLAFCLGAGIVLGSFFGITQLPGMLLQRKLEARLEEVAMGPDSSPILKASRRRFSSPPRADHCRLSIGSSAGRLAARRWGGGSSRPASRRRSAPCC